MKIVIAGGGSIGYYLAKTLTERRYHISLIEQNPKRCRLIDSSPFAEKIELTAGDAACEQILKDAGIEHCDIFIALTGQDQNNFAACMLARRCFHVKRIITRVNNPKNIRIFQALGVDSVISSASRIASMIEQEIGWSDIDSILAEKTDQTRISQFIIDAESSADGEKVSDLALPAGTMIVVVVRGSQAYVPNGSFVLHSQDELMIMGPEDTLKSIQSQFFHEALA